METHWAHPVIRSGGCRRYPVRVRLGWRRRGRHGHQRRSGARPERGGRMRVAGQDARARRPVAARIRDAPGRHDFRALLPARIQHEHDRSQEQGERRHPARCESRPAAGAACGESTARSTRSSCRSHFASWTDLVQAVDLFIAPTEIRAPRRSQEQANAIAFLAAYFPTALPIGTGLRLFVQSLNDESTKFYHALLGTAAARAAQRARARWIRCGSVPRGRASRDFSTTPSRRAERFCSRFRSMAREGRRAAASRRTSSPSRSPTVRTMRLRRST